MCTACALVGCQSLVSAGCKECFAQRLLAVFQMNFGRVEFEFLSKERHNICLLSHFTREMK